MTSSSTSILSETTAQTTKPIITTYASTSEFIKTTPIQTSAQTTQTVESSTYTPTPDIVYVAIQSGAFEELTTWDVGAIPTGDCSIIIPAGITVTINTETLNVNVRTLTINGTFIIASTSTAGFAFGFAINIILFPGGSFMDQSDANLIYCRPDTVFTFLIGASFTGFDTTIVIYTGISIGEGIGENFILGSSVQGAFTFAIFIDGTVRTFDSVMCATRQTGSFTDGATWLGGIAPTINFCALAGGCDLFIPSGFTLSTGSLGGVLLIRFNVFIISSGGRFQLGTSGSTSGFRFSFRLILRVYGTLEDVTGGTGGILLPIGSSFNFYTGARFVSIVATFLRIYDPSTGLFVGEPFVLSISFSGPFFIIISITGEITTTTTGEDT